MQGSAFTAGNYVAMYASLLLSLVAGAAAAHSILRPDLRLPQRAQGRAAPAPAPPSSSAPAAR